MNKALWHKIVLFAQLIRLNKPIGIWLLIYPILWGFFALSIEQKNLIIQQEIAVQNLQHSLHSGNATKAQKTQEINQLYSNQMIINNDAVDNKRLSLADYAHNNILFDKIKNALLHNIKILFLFIFGAFLTRSAGCAINDYADYKLDQMVKRTKNRPIANNSLKPRNAFFVAVGLSSIALLITIIFCKLITLVCCALAGIMLAIYPYTKRFLRLPQIWLAICYSVSIPILYIELLGYTTYVSWLLFIANALWVFNYDTIYAMIDMDDDLAYNRNHPNEFKVNSSAIFLGRLAVPMINLIVFIMLLIFIYIGQILSFHFYYYFCILGSFILMVYQHFLIVGRRGAYCFIAFLNNQYFGLSISLSILVGAYLAI